ncbi:MAG: ImuA family protein [Solirubrobacterales bacterium]
MPRPILSLDALRDSMRAMERLRPPPAARLSVDGAIDRTLPGGGLPLACLHQVLGETGPATAFVARLAGRLATRLARPVLWVTMVDDLFAPGLAAAGLPPDRLIVARAGRDGDTLWCMEEGLKCAGLAAVVGEVAALDLTAGRRLQLAAEAGGVTGFALHPAMARAANAGTTRWRVAGAPGGGWRLTLERCRGGTGGEWIVP